MNKKEYLNNLPIYDAFINEDDDTSGIKFISLVADPAIEIKGYCFNSELKKYQLSLNKEKQIVAGPAMIPNKLILREDENGNMYYIRFNKEIIKQIFDKFIKNNNTQSINIDHSDRMVPGHIEQFWYVADSTYDKSKLYGYNLPIGTPFLEVKVDDKEFWDTEIKDLGKSGFSIEGNFGHILSKFEMNMDLYDIYEHLSEDEFFKILVDINKNL